MSDDDQLSFDDDESEIRDTPHVRNTDPDTSRESADKTEAKEGRISVVRPGTVKHLALQELFRIQPATALDVRRSSKRDGIWKRVSDLKKARLLEEVGKKIDPETKCPGEIWKLNERGLFVLRLLNKGQEVRLQ